MNTKLQTFVEHLQKKDIDCAALRRAIDAAEGVDLSRVLWSLAHARHTRDIELYKNDMSNEYQQVIQRVADLCAMQAHTDVAPEAWEAARVAAAAAYSTEDRPEAAYSAAASARSSRPNVVEESAAWAWASSASASAAYSASTASASAAYSASTASTVYSSSTASAASWSHFLWERDTLTELITDLAYK